MVCSRSWGIPPVIDQCAGAHLVSTLFSGERFNALLFRLPLPRPEPAFLPCFRRFSRLPGPSIRRRGWPGHRPDPILWRFSISACPWRLFRGFWRLAFSWPSQITPFSACPPAGCFNRGKVRQEVQIKKSLCSLLSSVVNLTGLRIIPELSRGKSRMLKVPAFF